MRHILEVVRHAQGVVVITRKNRHRAIATFAAIAAASLSVSIAAAAPAADPRPPINDNYISSLELNSRGTKLDRKDTLKDIRDTSSATVQSDVFAPPAHGGPAEVTSCGGVRYGKTIWYDFYPDADGLVSIRTSGFDNVIALYPFSVRSLLPDTAHRVCVHGSSFPSEQLTAKVKKGRAYTFQIGGVVGPTGVAAGGPLQMLFDYFVTPPGSLSADATLQAKATSTGIQVLDLKVSATRRGARVEVNCGHSCRPEALSVPKKGSTTLDFSRLNGVQLQAGSKLQIRVTAPNAIGVFIQYSVVAGNFTKQTLCMEPGSRTPRRSCH